MSNDTDMLPRARIIGPLGTLLTHDNLPPSDTTRWTMRRKAEVVLAVDGGLLSPGEACDRYGLSLEELLSWRRANRDFGMRGLRATYGQRGRDSGEFGAD
jgi:hypothetical protein